jgi:hypothetical protein
MERNLYAPPSAAVADPVAPREERPLEVVWAVRLLWTSLAVGVVTVVGPYLLEISVGLLIYLILAGGARYVISVWVILRIASGHNWARILYLVVLVAGFGYMALNWQGYALLFTGKQPLTTAAWIAKTLLDIGAGCLLFMPRANRWFKPPPTPSTPAESLTSQPPSA